MTTQHTPGPWTYLDGKKSLLHIETAAEAPVAGLPICSINKSKESDARLIAAAPELLEGLRMLVQDIEHYGNLGMRPSSTAINAAKELIAKATNQTADA